MGLDIFCAEAYGRSNSRPCIACIQPLSRGADITPGQALRVPVKPGASECRADLWTESSIVPTPHPSGWSMGPQLKCEPETLDSKASGSSLPWLDAGSLLLPR